MSLLPENQDLVAAACAPRLSKGRNRSLVAGIMAGVTVQLTGVTVRWCNEQGEPDLSATMERVLATLGTMFRGGGARCRKNQTSTDLRDGVAPATQSARAARVALACRAPSSERMVVNRNVRRSVKHLHAKFLLADQPGAIWSSVFCPRKTSSSARFAASQR